MNTPKWLRRTPPAPAGPAAALTPEAERILWALEQGRRATMRPMPWPPRLEPDGSSRPR